MRRSTWIIAGMAGLVLSAAFLQAIGLAKTPEQPPVPPPEGKTWMLIPEHWALVDAPPDGPYEWVPSHWDEEKNCWVEGHWEKIEAIPSDKVWVPGHWEPKMKWVPGHWALPPRPPGPIPRGKVWVPPCWRRGRWVPGHWRPLR